MAASSRVATRSPTSTTSMTAGQVAVTLVVGDAVLNASQLGARPDVAVGLRGGRHAPHAPACGTAFVGVTSVGPRAELPGVMERLLDRRPVTAEEMAAFEHGGSLAGKAPTYTDELLCVCLQVPRAECGRAVRAAANDVAAVQGARAAAPCGAACPPSSIRSAVAASCRPPSQPIQEHSDVQSSSCAPGGGRRAQRRAGQHVVVRARIDGHAVELAYTISGGSRGLRDHRQAGRTRGFFAVAV
ncbi:MAG: hypothetical protein R3F43_15770 [bacterium]